MEDGVTTGVNTRVSTRVSTRVLIADDEAPARRLVRSYLGGRENVEVVGESENGLEVVDAVRSLEPQLVILDIQMPGMTGFEAIEAIGAEHMPAVIFATAYDEFALRAFDVHAVDYLLKPFSRERFDRAFDRALSQLGNDQRGNDQVGQGQIGEIQLGHDRQNLARLIASLPQTPPHLERLVVRQGERLFFVAARDILHLAAEGNYVRVHTAAGAHLIRGTLADLEARLDPSRFARIHRSGVVNIDAIQEVRTHEHGDFLVVLKTGAVLRLSRRYRERLLGTSAIG
jgi:two-component system, LytTR family, response regulator